MKKIIFLFTMALAVSMAMAQNTATTTQTGDLQIATTTQTGDLNNAVVTQTQDGTPVNNPAFMNKATVEQDGTGNTVTVVQNELGGGNKGNNTAFIQQVGDDNKGEQYGNAPHQNSGQHITAYQTGNLNDVKQSIFSGYTESLYTSQAGNENEAIQEATGGGNNHAIIRQLGNENWAKQEVFGNNNGYSSSDVLIEQDGILNKAQQYFRGDGQGHKNNGEVYQVGDENDAYQEGKGRDLNLQIFQTGDLNVGAIYSTGIGHSGVITQTGLMNEALITQNN